MVFVKKSIFAIFFFLAKKPERNIFRYSGLKIKFFGPQKWSSYEVEKNGHFAKGLVHGVSKKIDLFFQAFFEPKRPERKIFWYSG